MTAAAPETVTPPTQQDQPAPGQVFWRQLDIVNPERLNEYSFVVLGAGSTGSWTSMFLAKLGAQRIQVWDADVINEHNAPCQVYGRQETGRRKIEALVDHVQTLTASPIVGVAQMLDEKAVPTFDRNTVLVVCVDSMKARKYAWELAKNCPEIKLLIDPRLARETLRLYAVNPQDPMHQEAYEQTLYSDAEADGESIPCTAQAIVYTGTFTASFVSAIVASFVNGEPFYNEIGFGCRTFKAIGSYF